MQNSFGELLRSLRKKKKMRLQDVASRADIDLSYLSRIELGARPAPKKSIRHAIYEVLVLEKAEIDQAEASVSYKPTNSIFRAPLSGGKMLLMVVNIKDIGKLLSTTDMGLEKFVSGLEIAEADM
ncbi:helix-turn-helix domain-containing protein [Undibacterium curvum]|uniref:Helix-turn-helix domain-containing protein n=1 Tax=Undibacterium curvum TaxID=2762294 RepID=A0ABR7A6T7_9BURK|nr:helix-turn-helix transcriptional regulator [Undibacterium curvum]MBC3932613.1 helix-turn-helix domain-containing protein [Undibacterium curvum]